MIIDMKILKKNNTTSTRTEEIKKIEKAVKEAYSSAEKLLNNEDRKESLTYKVKFS
jgi:hypothetical protein